MSGQPVGARGQPAIEGPDAVLEEASPSPARPRAGCRSRLRSGRAAGAARKGARSSQTASSPVVSHVVRGGEREPQQVVGASRARAPPARRVPPVLHVSLHELAPGRAHEVLAQQVGADVRQGERVLELVAEAVGPSRLVVAAARPEAAAQRLVEQPSVHHHVEGVVGGSNLDAREQLLPEAGHRGQGLAGRGHRAEPPGELAGPCSRPLPARARTRSRAPRRGRGSPAPGRRRRDRARPRIARPVPSS